MGTTKRILHVYSSWTAGGAEKMLLSLASGLQQRGFVNSVACPGDSYLFAQAQKLGLGAYPVVIKGSFDPVGFIGLLRAVRKERVDIVHAHQGKVFWPCIFIKWLFPEIKVVFHRHAHLPHRFYSRGHYRWADRIIAIANVVARDLQALEKVPAEKIKVVYNGTDFARFNQSVSGEEVRRRFNLGSGPVIGTVAAMNRPKGKGQEYLIEAAQIVKTRYPDARYLIVGDGPIKGYLESIARRMGVADKVVFAGYQEEVEKFIAAMDIFCFLSWDREGFGQVMVEAQGMGKPVIGTNIGGIPETFKEDSTGFLIRPQDSEMLAQNILVLLDDQAKRAAMGKNAVEFVTKHFNADTMTDNVIAVYNEMYG